MPASLKRSANPPVGDFCSIDTPAFGNYFHAENHLWLRAQGTAKQADDAPDFACQLICASAAYTLADVVARMAEPGSELRIRAIALRDRMSALVVQLTDG